MFVDMTDYVFCNLCVFLTNFFETELSLVRVQVKATICV